MISICLWWSYLYEILRQLVVHRLYLLSFLPTFTSLSIMSDNYLATNWVVYLSMDPSSFIHLSIQYCIVYLSNYLSNYLSFSFYFLSSLLTHTDTAQTQILDWIDRSFAYKFKFLPDDYLNIAKRKIISFFPSWNTTRKITCEKYIKFIAIIKTNCYAIAIINSKVKVKSNWLIRKQSEANNCRLIDQSIATIIVTSTFIE